MKAKEMFEELGYKQDTNTSEYNLVCYTRINPAGGLEEIVFHKNKHFASFLNGNYSYIFLKEQKAINKQIEELGWNNESKINRSTKYD